MKFRIMPLLTVVSVLDCICTLMSEFRSIAKMHDEWYAHDALRFELEYNIVCMTIIAVLSRV